MTLDLLDAPLRVTWDLHGSSGAMPSAAALHVAETLAGAGVFFVTLQNRPLLHPELPEILRRLDKGGCRPLAACDGTPEELDRLDEGGAPPALLLRVEPFVAGGIDRPALERAVKEVRRRRLEAALTLVPTRSNLPLIPDLLAFGRESGVAKIKLPNTPLDDNFGPSRAPALPRPEDLAALADRLGDDPREHHRGINLEVHDLFLWELLFPGREEGRAEYGGCQAANSLGHVTSGGILWPCASWPEPLGSLLRSSLHELWESPGRHRLRRQIAQAPEGCLGCRDYALCLGGCRGLARTLNSQGGGRDPLCPHPRT